MYLVVNEWLPEYFLRTATQQEKERLQKFLTRFMRRNDILYVQMGSPFEKKLYRYAKENQQYPVYDNIQKFIANILLNTNRCIRINSIQTLPNDIENLLKEGNYESDRYLFQTAWELPIDEPKVIVTTDVKLEKQMRDNGYFEVILLEDFLIDY